MRPRSHQQHLATGARTGGRNRRVTHSAEVSLSPHMNLSPLAFRMAASLLNLVFMAPAAISARAAFFASGS